MLKSIARKGSISAAVTALVLLVLAGCGSAAKPADQGSAPTPPAVKPKVFVIGETAKPLSLDPQDSNDNLSLGIEGLVYEGLVGFDKDMKIIPVLAENYTASDDAKTFTFKLKKGIKFSSGTPLDSKAVKASFERVVNKANGLKRQSLYGVIDTIDTPDDNTVVFHLNKPFGAMIPTFAHPAGRIDDPAQFSKGDKQGKDFLASNMVGTGPYLQESYDVQTGTVTLVKNPNYWDAAHGPKVDKIIIRPTPEAATRINALKTGEISFISSIPAAQVEELKADPNIQVTTAPSVYAFYIAPNVTKKPFSDVRVRQAMNYAIDRDAIIKAVLRGYAAPLTSPIPLGIAHHKDVGTYTHDIAKAKQLLSDAGYPDGFPATVWLGTTTERKDLGTAIQAQLAEVGIKLTLEPLDSPTMSSRIWTSTKESTKLDLYLGGWSSSTGDADWALRPLLYGPSAPPASYNPGYYDNAGLNKLIEGALNTADEAKRDQFYADAQKLIWDDAPWVFLYSSYNLTAVRKGITGAYIQGDGILNLRDVAMP